MRRLAAVAVPLVSLSLALATVASAFTGANGWIALGGATIDESGNPGPLVPAGSRFAPDGRRLAYVDASGNVVVARVDGSGASSTFPIGVAAVGAWSPDATRLVVIAPYGDTRGRAAILDVYSGALRSWKLTREDQMTIGLGPFAWSPDGRRIAFATNGDREGEIWIARPDGSRRRSLLIDVPVTGLSWSPSGARFVFGDSYGDYIGLSSYIATASASGGDVRVLRSESSLIDDLRTPVWSPDGSKIAFSFVHFHQYLPPPGVVPSPDDVWVMKPDGTLATAIPGGPRNGVPGDWQPRCTILGTDGADTLVGTPGRDLICAGAGSDTIYARGGNDVVFSGRGGDRVFGGGGKDVLVGGPGKDRLVGRAGADFLSARGFGADYLSGGRGVDLCRRDTSDQTRSCP